MRKILIATGNAHKIQEFKEILDTLGLDVELVSPKDFNDDSEPVEDGKTYKENSYIKAKFYYDKYHLPTIADDSGIEIEAYGWGPGIHSHRFLNGRSYPEACRDIVSELRGRTDRAARYCCAVVCCFPDGREIHAFATTEGEIAQTVSGGSGGFGYDPMFLLPEGRTMADLSDAEKNAISHRGRAFRQLMKKLENGEYDVKQ